MKSVVIEGGRVGTVEAPSPKAGAGEEIVVVGLVAVSRSDLVGGKRGLGRALVGVRERDGVRVAASPDVVCGTCERCRSGLGAHCERRRTLGEGAGGGAVTERLALPARNLVEIPEHVPAERAALALLTATALQAAGRLHIREKPYATVIGAGAEAVLVALALGLSSATARVLTSCAHTLAACEKRGLRSRRIDEAGRRGDQGLVVVTPGEPGAFATALEMASPRGKVVVTPGASVEPAAFELACARELDVLGSRWAPIGEGLGAIAEGRIDPSGLLDKRVKLDRAAEGVEALRDGRALALGIDIAAMN